MVNRGVAPLRVLHAEAAGSEGAQKECTVRPGRDTDAGVHDPAGNRTEM